jgi:hypothetical protein
VGDTVTKVADAARNGADGTEQDAA